MLMGISEKRIYIVNSSSVRLKYNLQIKLLYLADIQKYFLSSMIKT